MTNQEIYNKLTELEFQVFKKLYRDGDREGLSEQELFEIHNNMLSAIHTLNMYYKTEE